MRTKISREMTPEEQERWDDICQHFEQQRWIVVGYKGQSIAVVHPDFPGAYHRFLYTNCRRDAEIIVAAHNQHIEQTTQTGE